VVAVYPAKRTMTLDYPFVTVATDAATTTSATHLLNALRGSAGQAELRDDGFRTSDGKLGALFTLERGVDPAPATGLYVPTADQVSGARSTLDLLRAPSQVLAVLDVSGSMSTVVAGSGGKTRLDLMTSAAYAGVAAFPPDTNIGLWEFSTDLGGGRDYKELVPVGPIGMRPNGVAGNTLLVQAISGLQAVPNGGTGLYDTALAAVRAARKVWDPKRGNGVVLLTDGKNEDPNGISLETLIATLKKENQGGKVVQITTIAYGPDSDQAALTAISEATGAKMYPALDPRDVTKVLDDAISRRVPCTSAC
jgi:Ca-activated chloride channel family protein